MPTTNHDIIRRAYRKLGQIEAGGEPSAAEVEDAMFVLQSLYDGLVENGAFGRFTDVLASADYTAKEGERIIASTGVTVTLPDEITGDDPDPRQPKHFSAVIVKTTTGSETHVYDGYAGAWKQLSGLDEDDEFPFANGLAEGVAALLAIELSPDSGAEIPAAVVAQARKAKGILSYRGDSASDPAELTYF